MAVVVTAAGEVELRLPMRCSLLRAQGFLASQTEWILGRLAALPELETRSPPVLTYLGRSVPQGGSDTEVWLKDRARRYLPARLFFLARKHGLEPQRVQVRDQRSRWGSCSSRGTVSLNWRLIQLPRRLSDAVLLHELAHLVHLNHGPGFQRWLDGADPGWRAHRRELRGLWN
ncbi:MAG: M48 family metallopeptidase, partial [Magnetococcales bacterium]|nr:M48 family metallopeptidase [Magnetococcales bacterium]